MSQFYYAPEVKQALGKKTSSMKPLSSDGFDAVKEVLEKHPNANVEVIFPEDFDKMKKQADLLLDTKMAGSKHRTTWADSELMSLMLEDAPIDYVDFNGTKALCVASSKKGFHPYARAKSLNRAKMDAKKLSGLDRLRAKYEARKLMKEAEAENDVERDATGRITSWKVKIPLTETEKE